MTQGCRNFKDSFDHGVFRPAMTTVALAPTDLLQDVLDRQPAATMSGDTEAIAATMSLPYRRSFLNHETVVETADDLARDFGAFTALFNGLAVNQFVTLVSDAEALGPDHITGHFVCHVLRNGVPMVDSYSGRGVAHYVNGAWCMTEVHINISVLDYPFKVVQVPFDKMSFGTAPEDDARRSAMSAFAIYDRYVQQIATAVGAADFDGYCHLHLFPYTAHGSELDQVIAHPDDLQPFYETLRRCHDGTVGDTIIRSTERAEFIGPDLICGYHVGRVFKDGVQTVDDVNSRMILKRDGARWRLKTVANSISNLAYPFSMYEPGGQLQTHIEIQKRTKK
jgi:hypothetical protein